MEIYLSVELENKYYMNTITLSDIVRELVKNKFSIKNGTQVENIALKDLEFEGKEIATCSLVVDNKCEVFIDICFK